MGSGSGVAQLEGTLTDSGNSGIGKLRQGRAGASISGSRLLSPCLARCRFTVPVCWPPPVWATCHCCFRNGIREGSSRNRRWRRNRSRSRLPAAVRKAEANAKLALVSLKSVNALKFFVCCLSASVCVCVCVCVFVCVGVLSGWYLLPKAVKAQVKSTCRSLGLFSSV